MSEWDQPENHQEKEEGNIGDSHERKMPDFIYVDTDRGSHQQGHGDFTEQLSQSFGEVQEKKYPFILRVVCLVTVLFLLLILALTLPFLVIFFLANLCTFFKFDVFWKRTKKIWEAIKKVCVITLGLTIAIFSPALGFSVMIAYFFMHGQSMDDQLMTRIMKSQFER